MASASTIEPRALERFGEYRLVRRLAIGGSAEVFLAKKGSKLVVLKLPLDSQSLDYEARIGARLVHEAIARVLGVAHEGERSALVVEYIDGVPLAALITDLETGTALRVVVRVAEALAAAHGAEDEEGRALGVVHRDVNPRNILVSREGAVKLLDFGIARSTLSSTRTRTGALKGTLRYLAPEQATGSEVDHRADIHLLGLVAFELLAGEPFHLEQSELALLRRAEDPPSLDERGVPETCPEGVKHALGSALARFPEQRPQTAIAFARALEPFAEDEDEAARKLARLVNDRLGPIGTDSVDGELVAPAHRFGSVGKKRIIASAALAIALGSILIHGLLRDSKSATESSPRMTNDAPSVRADAAVLIRGASPEAERDQALAPASQGRASSEVEMAAGLDPSPTATPRGVVHDEAARGEVPGNTGGESPANTRDESPANTRSETPANTGGESPANARTETPANARADASPAPEPPRGAPTRELVREKLARADARILRARASGVDVAPLESLSRRALEAYIDGRYVDADALLDRLLEALP